jgi:hypothetical protein
MSDTKAAAVGVAYATVDRWCGLSGMGRTATYEAMRRGDLIARKVNSRPLIDVQAGLAWIASQPALYPPQSASVRHSATDAV